MGIKSNEINIIFMLLFLEGRKIVGGLLYFGTHHQIRDVIVFDFGPEFLLSLLLLLEVLLVFLLVFVDIIFVDFFVFLEQIRRGFFEEISGVLGHRLGLRAQEGEPASYFAPNLLQARVLLLLGPILRLLLPGHLLLGRTHQIRHRTRQKRAYFYH